MLKQKTDLVELRFPVGGLNRQSGFDQQPPYTTPYCYNVWPYDVVNLSSAAMHGMRQRGGARPGLAKAYADACSDGPIQMLTFASILSGAGATSHILLGIADGKLYQNVSGAMALVTGSPQFDTAAILQGTQVNQKFYIADYRPTVLKGEDGAIGGASHNRLSDNSAVISDWTTLGIDTAKDVVYISGNVDTEANIFPITSVTSGYIVFDGTMTDQTSGVTWEIGRVPKVFDPAEPTAALTGLMDIPTSGGIPPSNYRTGTITINSVGWVTLDDNTGTPWTIVPSPINYTTHLTTLTIKNKDGIGTTDYRVQSINGATGAIQLLQSTDVEVRSGIDYVLTWTSTKYGIPPLNCPLCCTYRGRLVLAGPGAVWYMSAVLDPNNWDYGFDPSVPTRAIAGTSTTTGGIPEPILALMPHSDSYLIFGCANSLWILTADPAYGGTIEALSRDVGVLGPNAWCNLPDGSIVFLSRDGLYQIPAGGRSYPQSISRSKLPAELLDVNTTTNTISMCYDVANRGIHLSITPTAGTAGIHYFLDWTTQSFWPVIMPNGLQPTAMIRYAPSLATAPTVIFGSFDGYLRKYLATQTADVNANGSTTAIASLITYGPFRVGGPGYYGEILQLAADLDSNGQGSSWKIYQGDTAEDAVAAAVAAGTAPWSGTFVAGMNHRQFPHAVGVALAIVISGAYGWAIEGMRIEGKRKGPIR